MVALEIGPEGKILIKKRGGDTQQLQRRYDNRGYQQIVTRGKAKGRFLSASSGKNFFFKEKMSSILRCLKKKYLP